MKTIYKYPIVVGYNTIHTYENCKILSAGLDPKGSINLWVLVDTKENKTNEMPIMVTGTGWDFPEISGSFDFIDSVREGNYVWHIFAIHETSVKELIEDINIHEEEKRIDYLLTGEK